MGSNKLSIDVDQISKELRIRPEIYIKIAIGFATNLSQKLISLNNALAENNKEEMRRILHEIKGTSSNLRLQNISEPENIMHIAVKSGEPTENLEKYFKTLKNESGRLEEWALHITECRENQKES